MDKVLLPASLRTGAGEARYQKAKRTRDLIPLDEEEHLKEWDYWCLIKNRFPYSAVFKVHHMLIPKRRVGEKTDLTKYELEELEEILECYAKLEYHLMFENYGTRRSIKRLFHLHLATYYDNREDFRL